MSTSLTRRSLLKRSAAAAAVVSLPAIPWTARSYGQVVGANEAIRVGVIGLRGRGQSHTDAFRKMKGVRLVALCDADEAVLEGEVKRLGKGAPKPKPATSPAGPSTNPAVAAAGATGPSTRPDEAVAEKPAKYDLFTDLRKLVESKDVDVISIATPNHWHSLAAIWALQAGKDVYVEKPVSHNVWEGRQLVEASRKYNKICQAGTQSRSNGTFRAAIEWAQAGNLGKILISRGTCYKRRGSIGKTEGSQPVPKTVDYDLWLGPAAKTEPRRKQFHYDWHWFWDYGNGDLGNQGIHEMDKARWALGNVQSLSPKVISVGGRFGYDDDGQTPNTQFVVHDYGESMLIFEVRGLWDKPGTGKMSKYRGQAVGNVIECEGGYVSFGNEDPATAYDKDGKEVKTFNGKGDDHFANFIKAVRSRRREDQNADVLDGHLSSALCHTGNISYRLGEEAKPGEIREALKADKAAMETLQRFSEHLEENDVCLVTDKAKLGPMLTMDPKTERFVDNEKANAMLKREYRKGFEVPETV